MLPGPVTRYLLLRTMCAYAFVFGVGMLLAHHATSTSLQALGLGLILPGGGFALWLAGDNIQVGIHLLLAALGFGAFIGGLFLWFATGNVVAPPALWLAAALLASLMGHDVVWNDARAVVPMVSALACMLIIGIWFIRVWRGSRKKESGFQLGLTAADQFSAPNVLDPARKELPLEDLQIIRTLLDRALQPLDQFQGFNRLDQYQTAALRYQLNLAGYALAMFSHQQAPAFRGYLYEAQKNLILKNLDHRIWKFWQRENLWGNLRSNPDPCGQDNIMFTGFLATQIAMFHSASGETPFASPGSLSFRHPSGNIFSHNAATLTNTLLANFANSRLGLMACEPNWVYPLCNTIGAAALQYFAPQEWASYAEHFLHSLNTEFRDPAGNFIPCRSAYTGFALPTIGGVVGQAFPCFFLNATFPEIARQHWQATRVKMLTKGKLQTRNFWPVDVGNYGFTRASSFAATAVSAKELGDEELASAIFSEMERECPSEVRMGIRHRPASSFWAHSAEVLAKSTQANAFQSLMTGGCLAMPKLDKLSYPDVLVARAHSDGVGLEAVLYGSKQTSIGLINLQPFQRYRVLGGSKTMIADHEGRANFDFLLNGRTVIHIHKQV